MNPSNRRHPRAGKHLARRIVAGATLVSFLGASPYAMAGLVEISNAPLASSSTAQIPPNVMFILDASGSMNSLYMPDDIDGKYDSKRVGSVSHRCNTLYYNPAVTYPSAKNANGTNFANASFAAAENDPFSSDSPSGTTDLRTYHQPWGDWGQQRGFYFVYTPGDASWNGLTAAQKDTECKTSGSSGDGNGKNGYTNGNWKKVEIPAGEEQNFANWFSFYRTRLLLMKSSAGAAFNGLNDSFRVGFITICPDGGSCNSDTTTVTVKPDYYLKIDNFTPTHKQAWYDKFYKQRGNSYTPLRQALARVGRHYAGKTDNINQGMPDDPIQYSCQQNFAILTTDGYWNYGYGRKIDGSTMDNQDSNFALTPLPMLDGKIITNTTITNQQEKFQSRTGSPNCTAPQVKARRDTRTETIVNSVDGAGNVTTTTTYSATTSSNTCAPAPLTNTWATYSSTSSAPTTTVTGGVGNTLADVAEYYYRTDLRPTGAKNAAGVLVDTDNVPAAGSGVEDDKANHQHMTTFTLGLGVSGSLNFQPNYQSGTGDFPALRNGTKQWPNPDPTNSGNTTPSRIDDLWHAAVNGRGQAFSATDPVSLSVSLQTALTAINARLSSAAAAATSSLEPTLTDRLVFTPTYTTAEWSGEVQAKEIDITTGAVLPAVVWSAQSKLDARTKAACDTRKILLHRAGAGTTNLVDFTWNSDTCTAAGAPSGSPTTALDTTEQGFFGTTQTTTLTQWGLMTDGTAPTVNQKAAAAGANLVNFVRGQRGNEAFEPNKLDKLYRERAHVLGDIVNSQPVYVRQPYFEYGTENDYDGFKTKYKDRTPMVYVAANDGMLHAFNGTPDKVAGGEEAWAVIPREVLPRLHKLADTNYSKLHEYTVDGTPTVSDVYDPVAKEWRTIMVAPLNKGGRAYYALDVTDPDPTKVKMLWEFNSSADKDLGYSYGNPIISKLENGRWVVFVTSGLNNVSPGDGQGYLYVLDAMTGAVIHKIGTGVGDTTTPSGLTKIRNWVSGNASVDNTTARVYGVDMLGNVWRFDVNNKRGAAGPTAELLATAKDAAGTPQPLTTRPELAEVGSPPEPYVYVATGRYLGASDVTDTQVQSIYAIKDTLSATPIANLRTTLRQRIMTTDGTDRFTCTVAQKNDPTCDPNNAPNGWFVDLIDKGERVNVDMKLQLGTLVVASNVPANTACEPGGYSYKNYFDYATGLAPAGQFQPVGARLSNALAVGINIIRLPDGRIVVIGMDSSGTPQTFNAPLKSGAPTGKRITWREIPQ